MSRRRLKRIALPRPGAGRSRFGLWLAALALLLQAMLPAWHHPAAAAAAAAGGGDDGLSVVICTLYGYQVVPLASLVGADAGKAGLPEHKQPPIPRDCALCQALSHLGTLDTPPAIALPRPPLAVALSPWTVAGGHILPAGTRLSAQPRAPPALAI